MKDNNKIMFYVDKSKLNQNNNNGFKTNKDNKNNLEISQITRKNSDNINLNNNNINLNNNIKNSKSSYLRKNSNQNPQNILIFDNSNNLFNSIRNNQRLFDHRFIDEKTSKFVSFLEEPYNLSNKINLTSLIENRNGLDEFVEDYNWEYYELILFTASCKMNSDIFDKYNEYIISYLFDGLKKLNEINFNFEIANNNNKKYNLNRLTNEKDYFYQAKKQDFLNNSEEDYKLECAINNNNIFYYECFIYYKLNQCKTIDLPYYKFNNITIQPLLNVLKFKENLQELNLSNNDIGNEGCYSLGNILRINRNLSTLNITSCKMCDIGLLFLLKGIENKSQNDICNLTNLIISDNKLTEKSGKNLGKILLNLNKLQWYNISNNKINNKGAEDFFNIYKEILEEELNIIINNDNNNNNSNNIDLSNINQNQSDYLSNLSLSNYNSKSINNLETLILIDIGIYSESCLKILGDIIKLPKCGIKSLILSKNSIGSSLNSDDKLEDIKYFLECLKHNKTIIELYLLSCNIDNNIAIKIYEMLKENKTLENLVLYDNRINEQIIFLNLLSLFSNIKENHGIINNILKVLDLSKNNCHIKINNAFLNIIEELQLSSLDISQNELSRDGIECFKNLANRIGDRLKIIY